MTVEDSNGKKHDTIFDDEAAEGTEIAHIDFDLLDTTGRWLLKVVSGPNTGAEFSMQASMSYLIGTDTSSCDIVFHDLSVSRQHARITIDAENHVIIEDLGSRNGTFVEGEKLTQKQSLTANSLVTAGTTTFMLIDREGERKTIISPLLGTGEKSLPTANGMPAATAAGKQPDQPTGISLGSIHQAVLAPIQSEVERIKEEEKRKERHASAVSALMILAGITGLFVLIGVGTTMLFKTEPIIQPKTTDADSLIRDALKDYPAIRYSFNPATRTLLLVGHVLTPIDVSRILDNLSQLKFIISIDSSNIVIDEYVWKEINQVLSKNPEWKSITISSPVPGKFVMTGFLKSRKQAAELSDYISQNFNYPNLLEKKVIVEEDLKAEIAQRLVDAGFRNVKISLENGEVSLSGAISSNSGTAFSKLLTDIKAIPGVRTVLSFVSEAAGDQSTINISDRYQVTGYSAQGKNINVVINGRILTKGDSLDGMTITEITPMSIYLEKEGFKYRIDFNR